LYFFAAALFGRPATFHKKVKWNPCRDGLSRHVK
jgi:hypothetical protein